MGMYIGDIYVPFVSDFSVDKLKKKTELVKHCDGRVPAHLAEFQSDLRTAKITGTLLQTAVKTVDQYADDLQGAVDRSKAYNFVHEFQDRTGWLSLDDADVPKLAETILRKYSLSGMFLPKSKYQPRFRAAPQIIANDWSLTLGSNGCDCYVPLPIGATYGGGDGSTITRAGKDGTTTLVKATTNSDILFDLDADEVDVGECKVWDTVTTGDTNEANWVRVFSTDHEFAGDAVIENGIVRLIWKTYTWSVNTTKVYAYYDGAWTAFALLDYWNSLRFSRIKTLTPDSIEIEIDEAAGREASVYSSSFTQSLRRGIGLYHMDDGDEYGKAGGMLPLRFGVTYDESIIDHLLNTTGISDSLTNDNWVAFFSPTEKFILTQAFNKRSNISFMGAGSCWGNSTSEIFTIVQPFDTSKLFKECEDMTPYGCSYYTGTDASPKSGNTGYDMDSQYENVHYLFGAGTDLPLGTYKIFVRVKEAAGIDTTENDFKVWVHDEQGGPPENLLSLYKTAQEIGSSFTYVSGEFTLGSGNDGNAIKIELSKQTTAATTYTVDYVLLIPISLDNGNGPQNLAHQALVDSRLKRELVGR